MKLDRLLQSDCSTTSITRGIERECLRMSPDYLASTTPHPESLGSKLTNPYITTDFAECQLELITAPTNDFDKQWHILQQLHLFIHKQLKIIGELIWPASMPCSATEICCAEYPNTFRGTVSHKYRLGLCNRYGKKMQMICGLHYNLSFDKRTIAAIENISESQLSQSNIDQFYTNLAQVFFQYCDLLLWLTGKTPTYIRNTLDRHTQACVQLDSGDFGLAGSLSLRNSSIGYVSAKQEALIDKPLRNLTDYIELTEKCMLEKDKEFEAIPADGQLNDSVTQLPNELYLPIRLKSTRAEILPVALARHGVEYIEVRLLDLNLDSPVGIDEDELLLTEIFCLWCACQPSDDNPILKGYQKYANCAENACSATFELPYSPEQKKLIVLDWKKLAAMLDRNSATDKYMNAVMIKTAGLVNNSHPPACETQEIALEDQVKQALMHHSAFFTDLEEDRELQDDFSQKAKDSLVQEAELPRISKEQFEQAFAEYTTLN